MQLYSQNKKPQAASKSSAQTNPRLPGPYTVRVTIQPIRNSVTYHNIIHILFYIHVYLTLTLSLPYLRLACAELSLGPILINGFEELGISQSQTPIKSESQSNQSKTALHITILSIFYSTYNPYPFLTLLAIGLCLALPRPYSITWSKNRYKN